MRAVSLARVFELLCVAALFARAVIRPGYAAWFRLRRHVIPSWNRVPSLAASVTKRLESGLVEVQPLPGFAGRVPGATVEFELSRPTANGGYLAFAFLLSPCRRQAVCG
jgi:hypothetical protein